MTFHRTGLWPLLCLFFLSGCLPYACNRTESRTLFAADSLSRAFAESLPVDTLLVDGVVDVAFRHPRTVAFGPDSTLWVTDTALQLLVASRGDTARLFDLDSLRYPYLAGFRDGLPAIFSPEEHRIAVLAVGWDSLRPPDSTLGFSFAPPAAASAERALEYVLVTDSLIAYKTVAADGEGYLALMASSGEVRRRVPLEGPYWMYAGLLRAGWQGEVLSLSGYRPLIYRIDPSGSLDSLALVGFDSPMLARSRSFMRGDLRQAPLLSASAARYDSLLFVLNMRPGWLRVDVFSEDGRLRNRLVQPDPAFNKDYYPTDIAVMRDSLGYRLAIAVLDPSPGVLFFRWKDGLSR